jgi:hypothetical protein
MVMESNPVRDQKTKEVRFEKNYDIFNVEIYNRIELKIVYSPRR